MMKEKERDHIKASNEIYLYEEVKFFNIVNPKNSKANKIESQFL